MALDTSYLLEFGGVPFCSDVSPVVRMPLDTPDNQDKDSLPPRKHQPLPGLIDELNRIIPFIYLSDFAPASPYPGRNLGSVAFLQNIQSNPKPSLPVGAWFYPTDAMRWSVFRGLATSNMVKAMLAETNGISAKTFTMKQVPVLPTTAESAYYTLSSSLYMLPPRPLAEHGGKFDGLFLVTLVDERYYWSDTPVSLHVTNSTTWASLIAQLASALGVTITAPSISAAYGQPEADSPLWSNFESAAVLLDAIAFNIGCTVVRNLNGTYNLYNAAASKTIVETNRGSADRVVRTAGGDMFASGSKLPAGDLTKAKNAVVPSSVAVTFPKYVTGDDPVPHFVNSRYASPRPSAWYEESYGEVHTVTVPIKSGGALVSGLSGTSTHMIHTTAKAFCSGEVQAASGQAPVNASGLISLAMQIAQDYFNGQAAAALDEIYPGTYAWQPEGIHDIVWTYSDKLRQATTRVMRGEWNTSVPEMQQAAVPLSGASYAAKGVGGPSVAQSWADDVVSGHYTTSLGATLLSGAMQATLGDANYLPTQNRWKGRVNGETILFEGTSGGVIVDIVQRATDGTLPATHNGGTVTQITPNTTFGVNFAKTEKGQFTFPAEWTSGGIQGVRIVPQTQSVRVLSDSGRLINGAVCYSGTVGLFDAQLSGPGAAQFQTLENVWVCERNAKPLRSGVYYDGQLGGFSASPPRPVYLANYTPVFSGNSTSGCSNVILTDKDVRCEDGLLNIYQRPVALIYSDGCLTQRYGDWVYLRQEGCCLCSGDIPPSGDLTSGLISGGIYSGSPTSGCGPGNCSGVGFCTTSPCEWLIPVNGFNGNCDAFNKNWILPYLPGTPCTWFDTYNAGGLPADATFTAFSGGGVSLQFRLGAPTSGFTATYSGTVVSGDCCSPITLTNANCECDDSTSPDICPTCEGSSPDNWLVTPNPVFGNIQFTGDLAVFNGQWELQPTGPCQWSVASGTVTVTMNIAGLGGIVTYRDTSTSPSTIARYFVYGLTDCCTPQSMQLDELQGTGTAPTMLLATPSCSDQGGSGDGCPDEIIAIPNCTSGSITVSGGGGAPTSCCGSGVGVNDNLFATAMGGTGNCSVWNGFTVELERVLPGGDTWSKTYYDPGGFASGFFQTMVFNCVPGNGWFLATTGTQQSGCNMLMNNVTTSSTCSPFVQTFNATGETHCCTGGMVWQVTN